MLNIGIVPIIRMDDSLLLEVRYKFKEDKNYITVSITEEQYVNLLEIPIIERCDIIGVAQQEMTAEDKGKINEKIIEACTENELISTKYLLH